MRERSTDYAVNVLYVLGFISSGDGGCEAAQVLGMHGLPNDTTMESRSFVTIEERISHTSCDSLQSTYCEKIFARKSSSP
jgi:hypothetical protein